MSSALLVIGCAGIGLLAGGLLTVVVARVPERRSLRLRSRCGSCVHELSAADQIPVLSWLVLKGGCRHCGARIPAREIVLELVTGASFGAAAFRFGWSWSLPPTLVVFAALIGVSAVDLDRHLIPKRIVYAGLAATLALLVVAAAAQHRWGRLGHALLGAGIAFGVLLLAHLVSPRGLGFGDVRLAALLGLMLGWLQPWTIHVFVGLFLGFLLGSIVGLSLIALRLRSRQDEIPLGPFLAAGTALTILLGPSVLPR
ncbi:MAG: prepilin peptidase [Acidimicrobiales bacterium]